MCRTQKGELWRREALDAVGGFRADLGPLCDTFAMHALGLRYGACYVPQPIAAWRAAGGYAQATARDPRKTLEVIAHVAAAMREPEHRPYFGEDLVERWRRGYEALVNERLQSGLRQARSQLERARELEDVLALELPLRLRLAWAAYERLAPGLAQASERALRGE